MAITALKYNKSYYKHHSLIFTIHAGETAVIIFLGISVWYLNSLCSLNRYLPTSKPTRNLLRN